MSAGHFCRGSQANGQCPSFPAHHCTSGSLLPAAVRRLATSCSGASQELRPQQAPSSQQANSPLNYRCLAVFSRLQSRESAEGRAGSCAPSPGPAMLRRGARTWPHHHPQHKRPLRPPVPRTRAHLQPLRPKTQARGAGHRARRGAGAGVGGDSGFRPRCRADPQAHLRPRRPESEI